MGVFPGAGSQSEATNDRATLVGDSVAELYRVGHHNKGMLGWLEMAVISGHEDQSVSKGKSSLDRVGKFPRVDPAKSGRCLCSKPVYLQALELIKQQFVICRYILTRPR